MKDIFEKLQKLETKIKLLEDAPERQRGSVERFWDRDNSFFILAEHLVKIALFPNHHATNQWKVSISSALVNVLRSTSDSSLRVKGSAKSFVKHLHQSANELSDRINNEVPDAHLHVLEVMEHDIGQMRTDIEDYNSIEDLGFTVESYKDEIYGYNYRISLHEQMIADTLTRKLK